MDQTIFIGAGPSMNQTIFIGAGPRDQTFFCTRPFLGAGPMDEKNRTFLQAPDPDEPDHF